VLLLDSQYFVQHFDADLGPKVPFEEIDIVVRVHRRKPGNRPQSFGYDLPGVEVKWKPGAPGCAFLPGGFDFSHLRGRAFLSF